MVGKLRRNSEYKFELYIGHERHKNMVQLLEFWDFVFKGLKGNGWFICVSCYCCAEIRFVEWLDKMFFIIIISGLIEGN